MWNSTQWRVGMQQALRNGSISHSGTTGAIAGSWTFTVDELAICSSVKESKQSCISYCNKPQVILCIDGWKDLLSSVSLFGLAMLQLLDDCSCEIWRSCTVELTLNHQTRWLVISHRQCGHLCGWLCSYCIVSCGGSKICVWSEAPCRVWDYYRIQGTFIFATFAKTNLLVT